MVQKENRQSTKDSTQMLIWDLVGRHDTKEALRPENPGQKTVVDHLQDGVHKGQNEQRLGAKTGCSFKKGGGNNAPPTGQLMQLELKIW